MLQDGESTSRVRAPRVDVRQASVFKADEIKVTMTAPRAISNCSLK
jgi:hypothetical protein